jgi:predicted transporter
MSDFVPRAWRRPLSVCFVACGLAIMLLASYTGSSGLGFALVTGLMYFGGFALLSRVVRRAVRNVRSQDAKEP